MPDRRRPLFDGLPAYEEIDRGAAALIPYAELLRDIVDRRLYPSGSVELVAPSEDALFDDALRAVLERMIGERLEALTPEQLAAAYRAVHGDAAFAAALDRLAAIERRDLDRRIALARRRQEAEISGRLRLAELAVGEVLTIGLFDPARPDLAARRFADNQHVRPLHRVLQVRLVEPADGEVEVVRDTWTGAVWAEHLRTPALAPLTRGRLGTGADPEDVPAPELTIHAPLVFRPDAGPPLAPPQLVGYVETLDETLLLDGRASARG